MDYELILKKYWGFDHFRGIQRDIIENICEGHDTLGLMPTGGGKSITFQVPALSMDGVCIVVTPLIALMKDQVAHLRKKGVVAAAIYSGMTHDDILKTLENAILGGMKLLYVSPERLESELFLIKLGHINVSFIAVDEAHCISQWGYDFRPSYLQIAKVRHILAQTPRNANRHIPILALTATATPKVADDIQERLEFPKKNVFRMSFERKNLAYIVKIAGDKMMQMTHILLLTKGSAIVYVRSRKRTQEIAEYLRSQGISAHAYHAGLDSAIRDQRQNEWHNDRVRVIVATNAFGMGIDKPDVRVVIHMDCPSSIEAYFQEAGRAGRDGEKAYAVLIYNNNDEKKLRKRIAETYPEKEYIRQVYDHLAYFYQVGVGSGAGATFEFNIDLFCRTYHHFPVQVNSSLHILSRAGYLEYEEEHDAQARVRFILERDQLYRLDYLTKQETDVVTALLRNYTGLFTDYSYIDLAYIAQQADLPSQHHVYIVLKGLSDKRIVNFIPQRKCPVIRYKQDREEGERLVISPEVYEIRKQQFIHHVEDVINYAINDQICRSRQLLLYFGEKRTKDCGQCDVCTSHRSDYLNEKTLMPVKKAMIDVLSDGNPHPITDIYHLPWPIEQIDAALRYLSREEMVYIHGDYFYLWPKH